MLEKHHHREEALQNDVQLMLGETGADKTGPSVVSRKA